MLIVHTKGFYATAVQKLGQSNKEGSYSHRRHSCSAANLLPPHHTLFQGGQGEFDIF